tara:strand:- start:533 stop:1462 length:930 start_codon:yes stop_codon:yes gene_type:complete
MEKIPTISIKNINERKNIISKDIFEACQDVGFFTIVDHDLDINLIKKVLNLSAEFFNQSKEIKTKYFIKGGAGQRGYTPLGIETAKNSKMPDQKEFWHHGRSYWSQKYKKDMPENLLIKEVEDLNNELINLFDNFEEVGKKILSLVATALNLKENWFDNKINQGNSILRMIHYPKLKNNSAGLRAEAHEDINLITLLIGTEQEGLEVLNKEKKWIPIDVGSNKIVCNVGDMLQRLTNDNLKSTTHRVCNPKGKIKNQPRYSIPFFLHLNPDYIIETLPNCIDKTSPNKYLDAISANDFLKIRLEEINLK